MTRCYIAGPMTGKPALNFPAFHDAAAKLRSHGFEVVSPAEVNPDPAIGWSDALRRDIPHLLTCEAVVLLDGWQHSRGARLERHIAESLGMPCWPIEHVLPVERRA